MNKKTICLALAALASSVAMAAPPSAEPTARYIVQFHDALQSVQVDLSDSRVLDRVKFGALKPEVMGHVQRLERAHGFRAEHGFGSVVKGFSASLTRGQLARLQADPAVKLVEADVPMKAVAQTTPYGIAAVGATTSTAAKAGDGLDNAALSAVRVFVVDTGISAHPDLNVVERVNYVGDGIDNDCNGHGTHVAGTIGARDDANFVVGVAPGVALSALKVLDCNGSGFASSLIKAFDYTASVAKANPSIRYVANASVGFPTGSVITTLDTAVNNAAASGVLVAVAAGNSADNTCGTVMVSQSSATEGRGVMAVSAVDSASNEASFSSYGGCIATWAPGVSVLSTSNSGSTVSLNGTSMATPHVAGAAAVIRANDPSLTPAQVDSLIKSQARATGKLSKDGRAITHLDISKVGPVQQAPTSEAGVLTPVLDFGINRLKAPAKRLDQVLTNKGTAAMNITGLSGLPSAVRWVGSTCSNVAPGAQCRLTLELNTSKRLSFQNTVTTVGATKNGSFVVKGSVQ